MARLIQGHDDEWVLRIEWSIDDVRQYMEDSGADPTTMTDNDCLNILKIMLTTMMQKLASVVTASIPRWNTISDASQMTSQCILKAHR